MASKLSYEEKKELRRKISEIQKRRWSRYKMLIRRVPL